MVNGARVLLSTQPKKFIKSLRDIIQNLEKSEYAHTHNSNED